MKIHRIALLLATLVAVTSCFAQNFPLSMQRASSDRWARSNFRSTGLLRLEFPVVTGQTTMQADISTLPSSLYFVVLEAGNLVLTNKLIVVSLLPVGWN